ncbi:oxidative DNA demethylase, partial [Perkinsus olseni]
PVEAAPKDDIGIQEDRDDRRLPQGGTAELSTHERSAQDVEEHHDKQTNGATHGSPSSTGSFQIVGTAAPRPTDLPVTAESTSGQLDEGTAQSVGLGDTLGLPTERKLAEAPRMLTADGSAEEEAEHVREFAEIDNNLSAEAEHMRIRGSPENASIESIGLSSDASRSKDDEADVDGSEGTRDPTVAPVEEGPVLGTEAKNDGGVHRSDPVARSERPVAEVEPGGWDSDEFASHQESELA